MRPIHSLGRIRTHKQIRTSLSIHTNTGARQSAWPRLKETEQLRAVHNPVVHKRAPTLEVKK
jgi:hypothetical protein